MDAKWYVGAQNDALFIIDQPPRPDNDHIVPDADVNVIAKLLGDYETAKANGECIVSLRAQIAAKDAEIERLRKLLAKAILYARPSTPPSVFEEITAALKGEADDA